MIYRSEHPNPQFERENWQCLNGLWDFEFDYSKSGMEKGMYKNDAVYSKQINVPFCVESKLSGIEHKDFVNSVWYRTKINVSAENTKKRAILHFGAVDYKTFVYVNEKCVGCHRGGYCSFEFDITEYLAEGENVLVVNAVDDTQNRLIPSGKQSEKYASYGCLYTRTTGIWQSVWLEYVPENYIKSVKYTADTENAVLTITADFSGEGEFVAEAFFDGVSVGMTEAKSKGGVQIISLPLSQKHLWQVGEGNLYDLHLTYGEDKVKSYFGLRNISISGNKVLINGKSVFQKLVLDQGFYPDGIYTAPSDEALLGDVELSLAMGFNGARLHQKVFEPRFLYHCDRLGYIVWGEFPSWGIDYNIDKSLYKFASEWLEVINRDFNHPAIITWCPLNETWDIYGQLHYQGWNPLSEVSGVHDKTQYEEFFDNIYRITKSADSTRPCVTTSGGVVTMTDIYDLHDYDQNPETLKERYKDLVKASEDTCFNRNVRQYHKYDGKMPYAISEYGGIAWATKNGWGYGNAPESEEEFIKRFEGLTNAIMDNPNIYSLCYTQLTDVEQEQNGLYYYNRKPKFSPEIIKKILSRKAAIEE